MRDESDSGHPILIVEDDESIRQSLASIFGAEGYRVFEAANGAEGLEALSKIPRPCVILLDMMMPILDGRAFMQALRRNDALIAIPVVVVSAHEDSVPEHAKAFVRKPFDLEALIDVVDQTCRSRASGQGR
jgi:CheY-like chemotaxis protein